jgi:rRNA maturation endonuclease Nob1
MDNCYNCVTILREVNNKKICPICGIFENNEQSESGGENNYIG